MPADVTAAATTPSRSGSTMTATGNSSCATLLLGECADKVTSPAGPNSIANSITDSIIDSITDSSGCPAGTNSIADSITESMADSSIDRSGCPVCPRGQCRCPRTCICPECAPAAAAAEGQTEAESVQGGDALHAVAVCPRGQCHCLRPCICPACAPAAAAAEEPAEDERAGGSEIPRTAPEAPQKSSASQTVQPSAEVSTAGPQRVWSCSAQQARCPARPAVARQAPPAAVGRQHAAAHRACTSHEPAMPADVTAAATTPSRSGSTMTAAGSSTWGPTALRCAPSGGVRRHGYLSSSAQQHHRQHHR
eukprot:TRINITY_DN7157_c0_g1_i19.p1 TRINITY_DN7157_c0_g1~~TRINITY_DN7157_c0_g1_i19.p1  ORF type:complete len:356 (+),score=56.99 TRINITY_DN7157_c0_g1_i19:145-1068(+)